MIQKKNMIVVVTLFVTVIFFSAVPSAATNLERNADKKIRNISENDDFINRNSETWEVDDDLVQCPWADFTSIQPAIDAAEDGDTIMVYSGVYNENLNVNKAVILMSASSSFPVIDGGGNGDVIDVNHDDVWIEGFKITGSSSEGTGVNITTYNNTYISGCNINGNVNGIWANRSRGHMIEHNWIHDNSQYGVLFQQSHESYILMNKISYNSRSGVSLFRSCTNSISWFNYIDNNGLNGISLDNASNDNEILDNTILDNLLNGVLAAQSQNITIAGNQIDHNKENGIVLNQSTNITIRDNPSIFDNGDAFPLQKGNNLVASESPQIEEGTMKGNERKGRQQIRLHANGILLISSTQVTILRNPRIQSNRFIGVFITYQSHHINVSYNTVDDNGDDGIDCKTDPLGVNPDNPLWPNNVSIFNNIITASTDEQIHIYSGTDLLIQNNTITDGRMTGITIDNRSGRNIRVTENTIERNGLVGPDWYAGILLCSQFPVIITNNTVCNGTREGIYIFSDSGVNDNYHLIEGNMVAENGWEGICIKTYPSHHNTFKDNTVRGNGGIGIWIQSSNNNTITECDVYNNTQHGIRINGSTFTNISNCTIFYHADDNGINLDTSSHITIRDCTIRNNSGSTGSGIGLWRSNDNQIIHCTIVNMDNNGIIVQGQSRRNTITNSTLFNNSVGIRFYSDSTLNTIKDCIIHGNNAFGVSIEITCHNNLIFNNYFNNTRNAKDDAVNRWNITKTPGINIIGGPFLGGNYWHDYTGSDTDGDGLGDTFLPYNCSGNIINGGDYHPLLEHSPNNPPNVPSNPNPPDGATGVSTTSDLSWTGGDPNPGDTVTYDVYFGITSPPPKVASNQTSATFNPGVLQYSRTYYWKIVAWDSFGASTVGPLWEFTTKANSPPVFGTPSPVNGSTGNPLSLAWSIPINDPEGNLFSWTIQCSNGQTTSGTGASNGTKSLALSGLAYSTAYKVWVNATDPSPSGGGLYTRKWYTFTTKASLPPVFGTPTPANGSTNNSLSLTWSIPINDPEGDVFSWTIQCSNGQTNSGTGATNGTKSLALSGLGYLKTYKVWVNATDPTGSGLYTRKWYTFTTQQQQNVPPNKPNKPSGTTSGKIKTVYTYTTSTTDPNGDQVYYMWDWGDGTQSSWLGPYNSGVTISTTHKWTVKGSYSIKVKVKDTSGAESTWSDSLPITMPYSYNKLILQFLELLFERFPHVFPILRHLMGY